MSKRRRDHDDTKGHKRTKLAPPTENSEIYSARQLEQLLIFKQDGIAQLQSGIATFRTFLDGVVYENEADDRGRRLAILREFLESQKPTDVTDTEHPMLGQLWQAWSFANQNHNDDLSSAIAAILALLVKALSNLLEFRDHGYLVCRTVLQYQHLRLVKRCLEAPRHKDFVISPCLRLLTEVANFDGGVLAKEMYKKREETFDVATLRRNLSIVKSDLSEEEIRRRPAIRTLAMRYVLSFLKYLHEGGKADILKDRAVCGALFAYLRDDPADLVVELLSITEQNVLKDEELPRAAKASLLSQQSLQRVTEIAERRSEEHPAAERAFAWLKAVATTPTYGILRKSGWYPPNTGRDDAEKGASDLIDLGLDSLEFYDCSPKPEVRNITLMNWILTLRPHSNEVDRDLILICFNAAPELIAAYFAHISVQLEPKLSNTWIGHASFLFEAVSLKIPSQLGGDRNWAPLPPQTNIMIENILPSPLTQKVLTKCLNHANEIITFFAIRLLILAFEKLSKVLTDMPQGAAAFPPHAELWHEASRRLMSRFTDRCPKMKDVIAAFRRIPNSKEHILQREAIARLLRLYYEITPLEAMEEPFDVSAPLTNALVRSQESEKKTAVSEVQALELEHLLQIARHSPGMRWFTKQGSLRYSPITTLLTLHCRDVVDGAMRSLISHVLVEGSVLSYDTQAEVLVASISILYEEMNADVWEFIDDCLMRTNRKPIKYLDDLEALIGEHDSIDQGKLQLCLLVAVLVEQASFVPSKTSSSNIMKWVECFLEVFEKSDSDSKAMVKTAKSKVREALGWKKSKWSSKTVKDGLAQVHISTATAETDAQSVTEHRNGDLQIQFVDPPTEAQDHPELVKWSRKDIDMALEDGEIEALMVCLCSAQIDVRTQALAQLHKAEDKLYSSQLDDKEPIYVLLGELIETYEQNCLPNAEPLPYLAGTFATNALRVQMDPTHHIYPKLNRFLNKGPEWRINRLPLSWFESTALSPPDEDDAYWKEVQWVLDWLVDGIRTVVDLEILRRGGVFERIMTLYASPGAAVKKEVRERIIEILWRCTFVDGGSTTLITRTGVLSWLEMVAKKGETDIESALRWRILETCDESRINEWSGRAIPKLRVV